MAGSDASNVPKPPAPARRYSDEEISRILRDAADLQARSPEQHHRTRGLTLDEIRQIAVEAGIDPRFVDAAAGSGGAVVRIEENGFVGGEVQWRFDSVVDGVVAESERGRLLQAIRDELGKKGEVEDVYGRMEWSFDDTLGAIIVGVESREGVTEIDVSARRIGEAGLWHGMGATSVALAGGIGVSALLGVTGPEVAAWVGAAGGLGYLGMRGVWGVVSRQWHRRLSRLSDAVTRAAAAVARPSGPEGGDG